MHAATAPLLTGDVARILGISPEMVRFLERVGRLKAIRTARGIRLFDRDDVDRLADERRQVASEKVPA